ncbi:MAG: VOC family protein [Actinobacteria bacterium]|nr:VOC family protein [Actinomycetota bacterium]
MSGWGVVPTIRVREMAEALAFYLGPLEFTLDRGGDGESNSAIARGEARLMLETAADHYGEEYNAAIRERLGSPSSTALYIESSDLAGFQSRLEAAGARIIDPLADRPWGQAEFTVEDHEGHWLTFWNATETP